MPLDVVDVLEPIKVDEQNNNKSTEAPRPGQNLVDAINSKNPVRQTNERVMGYLPGEDHLNILQFGHPLRLSLAKPDNLPILNLLNAEIGESDTDEIITVDLQKRGSHQDKNDHAVSVEKLELPNGTEPIGTLDLLQSDQKTTSHEHHQK
jgi:hypothetical protein